MRNLEQSVGVHRVLRGKGVSLPGSAWGTFRIPLGGTRYTGGRWAVCMASYQQSLQTLRIHVEWKAHASSPLKQKRRPSPEELERLIPLFFQNHEVPFQVHPQNQPARRFTTTLFYCPYGTLSLITTASKLLDS